MKSNHVTTRQTIEVSVPAWSHLVVDMVLAMVDDVEVPFVAKMITTAYDWQQRTDAVR